MIVKRFETRVGAEGWISTLIANQIQFAVIHDGRAWIVSYPSGAVYE